MNEEIKDILNGLKDGLDKCISHSIVEFSKLRAGKAHPDMLNGIMVEYYGTLTPLTQVANVNTPDARTLSIQPWEKSIIADIETAIINSNVGLTPQNDGEMVRINVPSLTEERRQSLVKAVKAESENSKISIRTLRKDANEEIKILQSDGLSEDLAKDAEAEVQKAIDTYIKKVDELVGDKEKEIMTI